MGEKPIKREGTKPEKLKCNRRDRPRIHPMKIWQTFRQGLGCNLLKKHKRIKAKSQKKEERTSRFQTGLSKPRNEWLPLGAAIHPAFLIGGPGSLRNAGEGQVENGLGRPSSDKEKWTGSRPRLGKARGGSLARCGLNKSGYVPLNTLPFTPVAQVG